MNTAVIRRLAIKAMIFAKKAVPYVLATASAAGTVAVTVEAVKEIRKNTPKVHYAKQNETIEDLEQRGQDGEIVQIVNSGVDIWKHRIADGFKYYWRPIMFCVGSLACQASSVFIFTKRQQQLIIATHQMESLLRRYAEAATATTGVGGAAVANRLVPDIYPEQASFDADNDGMTLFWDPLFNYWFRANDADFMRAAKDTSHCFSLYGADTVENFYARMGVDPPVDSKGNEYTGWGWYMDDEWVEGWCEYSGYIDINYSDLITTDDGLEYREVSYFQEPSFNMENLMVSNGII